VLQGIADRRLRVLRNQVNRGLPDSLNIGLAEAKADYVARTKPGSRPDILPAASGGSD
jgi:hypothetical protein